MFKPQNKIIIVDNVESELNKLRDVFLANGIGCKPILYDEAYDEEPMKGIRVAFFDINITDRPINTDSLSPSEIEEMNTTIYNDLAYAINQFIDKENGPYALIFWTQNKNIIDGFKKYINSPARGYSDTAKPFYIGCIDKHDFVDTSVSNMTDALFEELNKEKVKFLFDFENKASEAGMKTIEKLYQIIPKDDEWGENTLFFDNLSSVLSKIAVSTLGFEYSKERPDKAIYEGLLPILNSEILHSKNEIDWVNLLKPLIEADRFKDVKSPDAIIQRQVNTIFHIDNSISNKDERGVVIEIDKNNLEFLKTFNIEDVDEWISKIVAIKDGAKRNEIREKVFTETTLIAIEFSAACDYSQKKSRINKYILGIKTPLIDIRSDINEKGRIESSYHLGGCDFHFNNSDFQIWLNLNYVFGATSDDKRFGNPLFTFKKDIMDMLGNKYASHVSRIGITSF